MWWEALEPKAFVVVLMACIMLAVVIGSAVAMWDIKRNVRCPKCTHCSALDEAQVLERAENRHRKYHHWAGGFASTCQDPKCKGR